MVPKINIIFLKNMCVCVRTCVRTCVREYVRRGPVKIMVFYVNYIILKNL